MANDIGELLGGLLALSLLQKAYEGSQENIKRAKDKVKKGRKAIRQASYGLEQKAKELQDAIQNLNESKREACQLLGCFSDILSNFHNFQYHGPRLEYKATAIAKVRSLADPYIPPLTPMLALRLDNFGSLEFVNLWSIHDFVQSEQALTDAIEFKKKAELVVQKMRAQESMLLSITEFTREYILVLQTLGQYLEKSLARATEIIANKKYNADESFLELSHLSEEDFRMIRIGNLVAKCVEQMIGTPLLTGNSNKRLRLSDDVRGYLNEARALLNNEKIG